MVKEKGDHYTYNHYCEHNFVFYIEKRRCSLL